MKPQLHFLAQTQNALPLNPKIDRLVVPGQPFDRLLLHISPLYRRVRELYLKQKGTFTGQLASAPRSLTSTVLLENRIEYSPVENELIWAATDPIQSKTPQHFEKIRPWVTSVFHETLHRLLWTRLPRAPKELVLFERHLNFAESLVISVDMALSDSLPAKIGQALHTAGPLYQVPYTGMRSMKDQRTLRNVLHAQQEAVYFRLYNCPENDLTDLIRELHPELPQDWCDLAAARAMELNAKFVQETNWTWIERHLKLAQKKLCAGKGKTLAIPDDPLQVGEAYVITEAFYEELGL